MAWSKAGSTTTSSAVDDMDITSITASKFNEVLLFGIQGGTGCIPKLTFNDNENTVYADTESYNGGTDSVNVSRAYCADWSSEPSGFAVYDIVDIAGEEKLLIGHTVKSGSSGAGTAPSRYEQASKFVPSPTARITSIEAKSVNAGDKYDTDSNISALGSDGVTTPAPNNVQDNSIFVEKDTGKRYWFDEAITNTPTYETNFPSSTGWTLGQMSISNNKLSGTVTSGGSMTYIDISSSNIVDDKWVMRCGLKITGTNTGSLNPLLIGLGDSVTIGTAVYAAGDNIGTFIYTSDGQPYNLRSVDAGGSCGDTIRSTSTPVTNTQYYVEIIKNGASISLRFYDSSDFTDSGSSLPLLQGTNSGCVSGFDYFIVKPYNTGSGSHTIEITDLKVYSGVVNTGSPATWTWSNDKTRGVFGGGHALNVIDYITIATLGNATDFGDLTAVKNNLAGVSNGTRGVFGGGEITGVESNIMDYITIATTGNAIDFGDLTVTRRGIAGVNSSVRGVFGGGYDGSGYSNVMDYITIATTGNATDFGNLTSANNGVTGLNSDTRGVFGGGDQSATVTNVIQYITIASTGNATDFGDLTVAREATGGVASDTRGVFGGGSTGSNSNVMDYITISTTGNATDFGDLSVTRRWTTGVSSTTRGVFGGGYASGHVDTMDYITIATTGNATDFGDLTVARSGIGGVNGS